MDTFQKEIHILKLEEHGKELPGIVRGMITEASFTAANSKIYDKLTDSQKELV